MDSTLAKGLAAIEWMTRQQRDCRVTDLAQAFGMARSNAHRTLQTLVECGWAVQDPATSTYRPSLRLFELGALVSEAADVGALLRPHLARLAQATGETIHLAVLDRAEIVYLDKFDSPLPVAAYSRVGGRAAAYCVASGKALLAAATLGVPALRERLGTLEAHTGNSITDFDALFSELERTRTRGYAENREEWRLGVCGLGVPVFNARGEAVAAVGMSVPSIRFARTQARELADHITACARDASITLGYRDRAASDIHRKEKETRMKLLFPAPWLRTALLAVVAALAAPLAAQAQPPAGDYPSKPIRLIVPYPPGGGTDVIARIVQERFSTLLGQQVLIDNRGGAAGSIGTEVVAKSAPDGYTVLFTLSSHTINPAIYNKLSFDTAKDFAPVGLVASLPQILVANNQFAPNTVAELVALARAKPDSISFASVGNGSPGHLAGELLKLRTGTQMTHIPYRGGGPAVTDVMGGQVPLLWVSIPAAAQFVKAGKLKALAVSTTRRSAAFPDVPTMQEAGIADFDVDSWYAVFVPAKTPQPAIDRLNRVINTVVKEPEIRDKLLAQGSEGVGGTPEQLGKVVSTELVRWQKLAKEANIKVD